MHRRPVAALLALLLAVVAVFATSSPQTVRAAPSGFAGLTAEPYLHRPRSAILVA